MSEQGLTVPQSPDFIIQNGTKYVKFEVVVPEVKPNQGFGRSEVYVPVRDEEGIDILTVEAHQKIDERKTQMILSRLVEAVRELNGMKAQL